MLVEGSKGIYKLLTLRGRAKQRLRKRDIWWQRRRLARPTRTLARWTTAVPPPELRHTPEFGILLVEKESEGSLSTW